MIISVLDKEVGRIVLLLLASWIVWMGLDLFEVSVAYGVSRFECSIAFYGFKTAWPWGRWMPALVGIGSTILILLRSGTLDVARLRPLSNVLLALTAARLASLAPFVGVVFPPVGLLWSVHLSWALSLALGVYLTYPIFAPLLEKRDRLVGGGLLAVFGLVYILYGIFFVRTAILHGDEPQYLMITQSLIQDGDIDLSNTNSEDHYEYHQIANITPHKAPASPEGKIHNTHPVGIAALIAPAYWVGLRFLSHPRLTAALTISLLTALSLFLMFLVLRRADFDVCVSAIICGIAGTSPLLFLYSNQIYPDVAALVLMLPTLIVTLDKKRLPKRMILQGCLMLALLLPILHPRLLPLTCLLAWMLWSRIRGTDAHAYFIRTGGAWVGMAVLGYVAYHLHYTGDIWGAYKPGNAWGAFTPDPAVTALALVGQWLDLRIGLLNNAPVFGLAVPGLILLMVDRRKLGVTALLLYGATACVNANSDDWRFGFCLPSRFMISALPALLLPLACVLDRGLKRNPSLLVLLAFGTVVGLDTTIEALKLSEAAYLGSHLTDRLIASTYPLGIHLPDLTDTATFPWADTVVWTLIAVVPLLILKQKWPQKRVALLVFCLVLPAVFASTVDYAHRMEIHTSPSLQTFQGEDQDRSVRLIEKRTGFKMGKGLVKEEGLYVAKEGQANSGIVGYAALPYIIPSVYGTIIPYISDFWDPAVALGYYVVAERTNVRAYGNHEIRHAIPLTGEGQFASNRFVRTNGKHTIYQFVSYRGKGELGFGVAKLAINPVNLVEVNEVVFSREMNLVSEKGKSLSIGFEATNLIPGFYRFTVAIEDVDVAVWFKRRTDPLMFLVFPANTEEGQEKVRKWIPMLGRAMEAVPPDGAERPMVEAYLAPHWSMVPFLGEQRMQFEFENDKKQSIFIAGVYSGEYDLTLKSIALERRTFKIWEKGELKPYRLPPKP